MNPAHFQTYRNRIHKAPLVVRQQAEPLATTSQLCQLVRLIRMTMYSKGSEAEPLAELAYGLQVP